MLFRAYSGAGVSSKAVRDAETIHQIAVGLEKGRNVDGPGWVEELFGGKANHTLLARNDLGRHRDRLNFMVTNDLISGMFKGLSVGADPFRDEFRVDAYAARSGRGPAISRNDFAAGSKTMRLIRPNLAGNPDIGFSAWRSPLSPDEKEEYLRTEEIIGRRDAIEFIALQIGWLASDLWSGSINDVQYLAYDVGGVDDYEEDMEYTDSSLEPAGTDLSANCFAEGTPVLLGDGSSVAIDALPLGSRVQTALPGEAQGSDSTVDRETHRLVTMELPAAQGGGLLTIERIISAEELRGTPVGGRIYVQLDEHQLFGYAKVLSLEPCPALAEGPGRIVVARFRQVSPEVLDLWLDGAAAPLTVTASHPLWSVEEASYLQASRLRPGTHLLRHDGSTVRITQVNQRQQPTPVLNISVESDARYFAGVEGVLGHNSVMGVGAALAKARSASINPRLVARLNAFRAYRSAKGALDMRGWVKATRGNKGFGVLSNIAKSRSSFKAWERSALSVHGNSKASTKLTTLYRLETKEGSLLKWGITDNLGKRYSKRLMVDKDLIPVHVGTRSDMLRAERRLVETIPGPLNREPWARIGFAP